MPAGITISWFSKPGSAWKVTRTLAGSAGRRTWNSIGAESSKMRPVSGSRSLVPAGIVKARSAAAPLVVAVRLRTACPEATPFAVRALPATSSSRPPAADGKSVKSSTCTKSPGRSPSSPCVRTISEGGSSHTSEFGCWSTTAWFPISTTSPVSASRRAKESSAYVGAFATPSNWTGG